VSADDRASRSNRGFWLVVVPIFGVAIAVTVAIVLYRPTVRRNAAMLVESNLRKASAAVEAVTAAEGSLEAATVERLHEQAPSLEFVHGTEASDEPGIVSMRLYPDVWTGAARADSGACYFIRVSASGETTTGTIPGTDCRGDVAAEATAEGWPQL
jgi:hypothetical protein